jgi:hypothetical protein
MPLVPNDQADGPRPASILIVGPPKNGKTYSVGSLHRFLRLHKLPTTIVIFDFDYDGAEPLLRLAREGRERYDDKPGACPIWTNDIMRFRYRKERRKLPGDASLEVIGPGRDKKPHMEFVEDFNTLDARVDPTTGKWKAGQEIGAIIFDSLTELQAMEEDYLFKSRGKEIGEEKGTKRTIEWADWNLVGEKVTDAYMTAKTLPCYLVCTAHEDIRQEYVHGSLQKDGSQDRVPGASWRVPLLTYTLSMRIAKDFSVTVFCESNWRWRTRVGEHVRAAGTRLKDNLAEFVAQDFSEILS